MSEIDPPVAESARTTFVLPDTSVYLHCQFFRDVDWAQLVGRPAVTLLVPAPVMKELDKHKDQHPQPKRRERARRVVREIVRAYENQSPAIRRGVELRHYRTTLVEADFQPHDLDPNVPDDRILAAALKFQTQNPRSEVLIIARDGAMRLTAREVGFVVIDASPIEEADEPDPVERELQRAKLEITKLESRIPKLSLTFETGDPVFKVKHQAFVKADPEEATAFQQEKAMIVQTPGDLPGMVDASDLRRYSQEYADYLKESLEFFADNEAWREYESRTVELHFQVENVGRVSADSIAVELLFRASAEVLTNYTREQRPLEPHPPAVPRGVYADSSLVFFALSEERAKYRRGFRASKKDQDHSIDPAGAIIASLDQPKITAVPGVGYELVQRFDRLQQKTGERLGPIYVRFPSAPRSFTIEFTLRADHMEPEVGQLHVAIF